jgi:hypothetical protein
LAYGAGALFSFLPWFRYQFSAHSLINGINIRNNKGHRISSNSLWSLSFPWREDSVFAFPNLVTSTASLIYPFLDSLSLLTTRTITATRAAIDILGRYGTRRLRNYQQSLSA